MKTNKSTVGTFLPFILLMGGLVSCGEQDRMADLYRYVEHVHNRPGEPIEPLPKITLFEPHKFKGQQGRNPFRPYVSRHSMIAPDQNRKKEPLEAYSLDAIKLVGHVQDHQGLWALIVAPDATIHRVTVGKYLGQQDGKIISITPSAIKLRELVPVGDGWESRETTLVLEEKEK